MKPSDETENQPFPNQVAQLEGVITAMESSKFWQIRNAWFQLKQNLGLGSDNFSQIRSIAKSSPEPIRSVISKTVKLTRRSLKIGRAHV